MSKSNNTTSSKSKKRKRQEKLQQYGVDLPDIPGVRVEIIPVLVHALKVSSKFFQHQAKAPYNEDWEAVPDNTMDDLDGLEATKRSVIGENRSSIGNALDSVLNRMESSANESDKQQQQQEQRKIKMNDAVQAWLQAVKRLAKDHYHQIQSVNDINNDTTNADHTKFPAIGTESQQQQQQQKYQNYKKSQPLCCFQYIWNFGVEHKRLSVRRAALYMNRHLLDRSADCRRYFLEEGSHLWDWVQLLATDDGEGTFDATKRRLWQREGHQLLIRLIQQHYNDLYPKLVVSEQYLRQACMLELQPQDESEETRDGTATAINTNMGSLRQLRDIAMEHSSEEIRRVQRLIERSTKCMDILVPRLGVDGDEVGNDNQTTASSRIKPKASDNTTPSGAFNIGDNDDEEEEDDIDWEDGWEDEGENGSGGIVKNDITHQKEDHVSHAQAVERTLQAMESIGVGFRGGGLEINFDNTASITSDLLSLGKSSAATSASPKNTPEVQAARERFIKCAKFLTERHLPRIRAWLEGLQNADRLSAPSGHGSLILMSPEQGKEREDTRQQLLEIKAQMNSVVESAARLGLGSSNQG